MAQIPLTIVLALISIGIAEWPSVMAWSEMTSVHHALVHLLYLFAGGLVGIQIAWWARISKQVELSTKKDSEVIS